MTSQAADELAQLGQGQHGLVVQVALDPATSLTPWTGFAVLCGYAAVLLGLAAFRMRRGDA
jgi:hypothetical protein